MLYRSIGAVYKRVTSLGYPGGLVGRLSVLLRKRGGQFSFSLRASVQEALRALFYFVYGRFGIGVIFHSC